MSRLRKALILVGAVAVAAAYAWLRPSAPRFVGTEAGTREVKVRVVPIAPVPNQPVSHQEAETIQIEKMVEARKAEWERDAAARRGHTEP